MIVCPAIKLDSDFAHFHPLFLLLYRRPVGRRRCRIVPEFVLPIDLTLVGSKPGQSYHRFLGPFCSKFFYSDPICSKFLEVLF